MQQNQKIDSFMLCSEMESLTTQDTSSTISFGRCLNNKKSSLQNKSNSRSRITKATLQQKSRALSLKQIFSQYLNDPLSSYVLQFKTVKNNNQCKISKTINQKFGKYTTSIQKDQFKQQLNLGLEQVQQNSTKNHKFHKLSSVLKNLQKNKENSNYNLSKDIIKDVRKYISNDKQNYHEFSFIRENTNISKDHEQKVEHPKQMKQIKIQDYQNVQLLSQYNCNFQSGRKIKQSPNQEQSDIFLQIQSKVQKPKQPQNNHLFTKLLNEIRQQPIYESLKNKNNRQSKGSENQLPSPTKKMTIKQKIQFLSPLRKQNPENNLAKVTNLHSSNKINKANYQGFVEGLEFSKKLRKKTFKNKQKVQQNIYIQRFQSNDS